MTPIHLSKTLVTANAANICQSQPLLAAGDLTLNGTTVVAGVANLLTPRRVLFTPAGAEAGKIATIYGYNLPGVPLTETVTLVSNPSTVASSLDYQYITRIAINAALTSTITVGTNGSGATDWLMPSFHLTPFRMDLRTRLSGSVTYDLETTQDDYWTAATPTTIANAQKVLTGETTATDVALDQPVRGWRVLITAGTGTITIDAIQSGIANY